MQLKRAECYSVLGVSEEASEQEIRSAYKKLAMQYHPDKNDGSEDSKVQFQRINYAYRKLAEGEDSDEEVTMDDDLAMHMFMEMMRRYYRHSFFGGGLGGMGGGCPPGCGCRQGGRGGYYYDEYDYVTEYYEDWEVNDSQFEHFLKSRGWVKHTSGLSVDPDDEPRRKRRLSALRKEYERRQLDFDRNTHPIAVAMRRGDSADKLERLVTAQNVVRDIGLGNTPWHYAAHFNRYEALKLFTSRFDPRPALTIRNQRGHTPLDLCPRRSPAYQHLYSVSNIVAERMAQALVEEEEAEKQQKTSKADKRKSQKDKKQAQKQPAEPEKAAPAKSTQEVKGGEGKSKKTKGKTNTTNATESKQTKAKHTPPKEAPKLASDTETEEEREEEEEEEEEAPTSYFTVMQGGVAIQIPIAQAQKIGTNQAPTNQQNEQPTPPPPPQPAMSREEIERQALMLCEMGFDYAQAEGAVAACGGDLDEAISLLVRTQSPGPQPGPAPQQVEVEEQPEPQRYVPRICKFWPQGTCRSGSRCRYAHEGPGGIAEPATYVRGGGRGGRQQGGGFSRGHPSEDYYGYQKTPGPAYAAGGDSPQQQQPASRGPTNLPPRLRRAANY